MATIQDRETFGRARLSFAQRDRHRRVRHAARAVRERRDRPRRMARVPPAARHIRPAPDGRRADAAHQDSAGHPDARRSSTPWPTSRERYSRGFGHITTRQNIQLHFVKLHDAEPAMRELAAAGMTTREACGNSVRNITACPYSGVATDEAFDVTPYAEALTRYLLRHPLSSVLPRKFKIAFEGCARRSHRVGDQRHRLERARPDTSMAAKSAASRSRLRAARRR